ncbi:MAG: hypothetical protein ACIAXF_08605 [Phycisphaerales bacterium JB063]
MSAREFFNNNPAIVTGASVLVLVLCLAAIACSLFGGLPSSGSGSVQLIYYDMSNNTIKLVPSSDRPGSPLAENEQAFRCFVMTCGECGKIEEGMTADDIIANGMFISHLQTFPTADRMMGPGGMEDDTQVLMLSDENPQWYSMSSQDGMDIMRAVSTWQCEDGSTAKQCQP